MNTARPTVYLLIGNYSHVYHAVESCPSLLHRTLPLSRGQLWQPGVVDVGHDDGLELVSRRPCATCHGRAPAPPTE